MSTAHGVLPSRPSPGAAGARLGELYAAHARMVHGICRVMLRDASDAEDATQQVFLSAYRSLLAGTTVEKAGAWLATIARNECRARIETRMRTPLATAELDTLVVRGVEDQAEGRADAAELYAELAALPPKQREAVVLRDLYGLRYDEVAGALGVSRPAVEALLFRGRRRLQHRLRPRLVAGMLVVPLAIQESLAYAVPGFSSTVAPVGAAGAIVAAPLLAKLAAGGVAVALAGSAGVAVERGLHDRSAPSAPQRAAPAPAPATESRLSLVSEADDEANRSAEKSFVTPVAATSTEPDAVENAGEAPERDDHDEADSGRDDDEQPAAGGTDSHDDEPEVDEPEFDESDVHQPDLDELEPESDSGSGHESVPEQEESRSDPEEDAEDEEDD